MNGTRWMTLFGVFAAACSTNEEQPPSEPDVTGVYEAASNEGPIERLLLAEGQYGMVSRACTGGAAPCESEGTFALSADRARIELTDAKTGERRSIPFAVRSSGTIPAGGAIAPKGLCIVGSPRCPIPSQPLTESPSAPLVTPDQQSIVVQCTGNCAVTIQIDGQLLQATGQSLTVTVPRR